MTDFGVTDNALGWIASYRSERSQYVTVGNALSDNCVFIWIFTKDLYRAEKNATLNKCSLMKSPHITDMW